MNEEELKAIWQKNESPSLENFDFEGIKRKAVITQAKLRKKVLWDTASAGILVVLVFPLFFMYPLALFFSPILLLAVIWTFFHAKRFYKLETEFSDAVNLKESLQGKRDYLRLYVSRTRYFALFVTPLMVLASLLISSNLAQMFEYAFRILIFTLIVQIFIAVLAELYLRLMYLPSLDETEDLLRQLDETQ